MSYVYLFSYPVVRYGLQSLEFLTLPLQKLTDFGAAAARSRLQDESDAILAANARRGDWDEGTPLIYLTLDF